MISRFFSTHSISSIQNFSRFYLFKQCALLRPSLFFLVLLASHTPHTHAGLFTRAAMALEHSYQSVTNAVKNKYSQATEGLKPELAHWDWYAIDAPRQTRSMAFPSSFYWGLHDTTINNLDTHNFAELKKTGCNLYIISLDWQEIEPRELVYNHQKIQEYAQLCQELKNQQITPAINLFDGASTPAWFADKGGFANYHALPAFVHYAQTIFKALGSTAPYWITAHNPAEYACQLSISGPIPGALSGPISGATPSTSRPHKRGDFEGMLNTLEHILIAHRDIYTAFKKMPGGNQARIGIGLDSSPILSSNTMNPLLAIKAEKLTKASQASVRNLLNNNRMDVDIQGTTKDNYIHSIEGAFDFLVINYTAPRYLQGNYELQLASSSYPEGLYYAIKAASEGMARQVPLLINHCLITGTSSAEPGAGKEDERVAAQKHLYALNKAVKEGYRVMGYVHAKSTKPPIQSHNQAPQPSVNPTPKK